MTTEESTGIDKLKVLQQLIRSGIIANLALGFGYLILLNGLSTQGFDLETLKAERIAKQRQLEVIDISLAIPASIYALESNEVIQEMPVVTYKNFLEVRNSEVATLPSNKN